MALLDSGANVDLQSKEGDTPLIYAAKKGNVDLITLLVNATANPNLQEHTGKTALHWAVINRKANCVRALLWGCPDLNIRDHDGMTAYDIAQYKPKEEVLQLLEGHDPSNCTMNPDFMNNDVY
nr:acyl-CoA-binding domain-containing protein 4-like [Penaeus vannamei]